MRGVFRASGHPVRRTIALVILAATIRLLFFTGFHGFDDVFYIKRAFALSEGLFKLPTNLWAARIGLVGPTALVHRLFGVTLATSISFPFVCSLLTVVVAARTFRHLRGESLPRHLDHPAAPVSGEVPGGRRGGRSGTPLSLDPSRSRSVYLDRVSTAQPVE